MQVEGKHEAATSGRAPVGGREQGLGRRVAGACAVCIMAAERPTRTPHSCKALSCFSTYSTRPSTKDSRCNVRPTWMDRSCVASPNRRQRRARREYTASPRVPATAMSCRSWLMAACICARGRGGRWERNDGPTAGRAHLHCTHRRQARKVSFDSARQLVDIVMLAGTKSAHQWVGRLDVLLRQLDVLKSQVRPSSLHIQRSAWVQVVDGSR